MSHTRWAHGHMVAEPQKFAPVDAAIVVLQGAANLLEGLANVVGGLAYLAKAHANYARDRAEFKTDLTNTIERL